MKCASSRNYRGSLVHCDIVNNDYQQDSRVLYIFVPNKPFGSLLEISPTHHIFLKTFNLEYDEIKVWFTDQNCQALEIEDRINLTMVIKDNIRVNVLKKSSNNNNNNNNDNNNEDVELITHKKRYISPKERQLIINELRLIPKKDGYF